MGQTLNMGQKGNVLTANPLNLWWLGGDLNTRPRDYDSLSLLAYNLSIINILVWSVLSHTFKSSNQLSHYFTKISICSMGQVLTRPSWAKLTVRLGL